MFLVVHNTANGQGPSAYHIITRQAGPGTPPTFTFQKLSDPVEPFANEKAPHITILRIKDFPPNIQDLLVVSSTAYEGIGLFTRSKTPLTSDKPADSITNVFTTTEFADDSKRAQLPMSEDLTDTFPIGNALDLSSKNKVYKPIPTDEIDESPGPLPGLWVLNNEGVLASWWVVYNESIRTGTTYPGMVTGEASAAATQPAVSSTLAPAFVATASTAAPSVFGTSALGKPLSPWAAAGGVSPGSAFGSSSFANTPAPAPAFGSSTFGSKPAAPAFGQSSSLGLGTKASPWQTGSTSGATPSFGQTGLGSVSPSINKVFGSAVPRDSSPASGGFASFANKSGFGSLGGSGAAGSGSIFGSGSALSSTPQVSMDTSTSFPPPKKEAMPAFGSSPFVLGTTFKADPSTAGDNGKPKDSASGSLFGGAFGLSLSDAAENPAAPEAKDEDMESTPAPTPAQENPKSIFSLESTTPTTTPAPQRFGFATTSGPAPTSNIFGTKPFATPSVTSIFSTPKPAPAADAKPSSFSLFGAPKIKQEDEDKENLAKIPEAPIPPDTTSKAVFPLGDSSSSAGSSYSPETAPKTAVKTSVPLKLGEARPPPDDSSKSKSKITDAAPLPPDFITKKPKAEEAAPLPPDFLAKPLPQKTPDVPAIPGSPIHSEDEPSEGEGDMSEEVEEGDDHGEEGEESGTEAASEGSVVDVTKEDFSLTTGFVSQTPGFTPQSSFGKLGESSYSTISRSEVEPPRTLFGEINKNAPPLFPKPMPQSPRSPSPVRGAVRPNLPRPLEPHRSVSAPGVASHLLGRQAPLGASSLGFGAPQRPVPVVDPNVEIQRKLAAKKEAEERALVDPEDEGIRRILQAPIEPSFDIDEFLTVDTKLETVAASGREEVPVACETLWRDINRMIDRLGLNSRSLQSFISGHTAFVRQGGRGKEDLVLPDDWVLLEAEELGIVIEDELAQDLEEGRVKDVEEIEATIKSLLRDLAKLRAKDEDLRKAILPHVDPDQISVTKSLPLSAEQSSQQNELRKVYGSFTKLLSEAEQALTLLKAKITSAGGASGKAPVPTVEAIIRTINKMTSMAEKRSGDIDVLENQMRRLRLGSVGLNSSPGPSRSREGSPFATPQKRTSIFSPDRLRDSVISTPGSYGIRGTPPRKKLTMYSGDEVAPVQQKLAKRKATLRLLKESLEKAGPNVSRLRDDD